MITAAAMVLLAIAGTVGTIGALIQARRAEREAIAAAATAQREASVSAAISEFLNRDLLYAASPRGGAPEITVRAALERAAAALDGKFPDFPEVEAALRLTLGRTFRHLGEREKAEAQLRRVVEIGRHGLAPGDGTTLESLHELGLTLSEQQRFADALQIFDEALAANPQRDQSNYALRALQGKALVFLRLDRNAEALPALQDVIARKLVIAPDDVNLPRLRSLLGVAYLNMGRSHEAVAELTEAERSALRIAGPHSQDTLTTQSRLCSARIELGQYADAAALCALVAEDSRRVLGADDDGTFTAEVSLARLRHGQGKHKEAEALLRQVLAGRGVRAQALALLALGDVIFDRGHLSEAKALYRAAVESVAPERARGETASRAYLGLASVYAREGRLEDARSHLRTGREMIEAAFPPPHWFRGEALLVEGELLILEGHRDKARSELEHARTTFAPLAPSSLLVRRLGEIERALGR